MQKREKFLNKFYALENEVTKQLWEMVEASPYQSEFCGVRAIELDEDCDFAELCIVGGEMKLVDDEGRFYDIYEQGLEFLIGLIPE